MPALSRHPSRKKARVDVFCTMDPGSRHADARLVRGDKLSLLNHMRFPCHKGEGIIVVLIALMLFATPAHAEVRRVVSLNPCLDNILVKVADWKQIAALSHYARDAHSSSIADIAADFPAVGESAEDVIMLRPDLVLAGFHNSPATRTALRRLGIREETFRVPETVADSIAQVREIAKLVGHAARGEEVAGKIEAALAAAEPPDKHRPTALIFQSNGLAPGRGTLADEMLTRTGFTNAAGRYTLQKWQNVPLERLIADPPDVLLVGEVEPGRPTWADRVMTHPALKSLGTRTLQARFPERLLYCGGPVLIDTAAVLAKARRRVAEMHP
jgi:iron complex transport system substrate-binding protein